MAQEFTTDDRARMLDHIIGTHEAELVGQRKVLANGRHSNQILPALAMVAKLTAELRSGFGVARTRLSFVSSSRLFAIPYQSRLTEKGPLSFLSLVC